MVISKSSPFLLNSNDQKKKKKTTTKQITRICGEYKIVGVLTEIVGVLGAFVFKYIVIVCIVQWLFIFFVQKWSRAIIPKYDTRDFINK